MRVNRTTLRAGKTTTTYQSAKVHQLDPTTRRRRFMACYDGFGFLADARPFWVGDFTGDKKTEILFYTPNDSHWFLGRFDPAGNLTWTFAGDTAGFGQVWDGRPFWVGDFTGDGKTEILFYSPKDTHWFLGRFDAAGKLNWN